MNGERNRLSFRIPWVGEMTAEGPLAILVWLVVAIAVLCGRAVGWW